MKRILVFTLLFAGASLSLIAQKEETLSGRARVKGGFGGPFFGYSQADGQSGAGGGGGGALILNDIFIGGFGQGESFGQRTVGSRRYTTELSFGGFWIGYTYPSHKVIHLYTSLKIGWGNASLRYNDNDPFDNNDINDGVFVLAPELGAEVNVLHWFRIAMTAGYRLVNGVQTLPGFSEGDFNSPTLGVTLRFGGFGYH